MIAGCEYMTIAESTPRNAESNAGTSQLVVRGGAVLISSKTSSGAAKTFNSRPASEVAGVGGVPDGGPGVGAIDSTLVRFHPLLRQNPAKVTRKVGFFDWRELPDGRQFPVTCLGQNHRKSVVSTAFTAHAGYGVCEPFIARQRMWLNKSSGH